MAPLRTTTGETVGGRIYARFGVYTVTLREEDTAKVVDAQAVPPPGSAFKPNPRTHAAGGRLCPAVSKYRAAFVGLRSEPPTQVTPQHGRPSSREARNKSIQSVHQ